MRIRWTGGVLLLGTLAMLSTLVAAQNELPDDVGERLVAGERLKIGLVGDVIDGESLWLVRRVGWDGAIHLPTNVKVVVAGLPRGQVEQTLAARYGAEFVIISRLDRGEDHGGGAVVEEVRLEDPDLSRIALTKPPPLTTTLQEALEHIAKTTGLNIIPNWAAFELEGVDRTTEIDVSLPEGIPVGQALSILLEQASGGFAELDWVVKDGIVHVTTLEDLAQRFVTTELHDVRDMLSAATPGDFDRQTRVQQIIELIQDTVESDAWKVNGGTIGSIAEMDGVLVITATPAMHEETAQLLDKLRQTKLP